MGRKFLSRPETRFHPQVFCRVRVLVEFHAAPLSATTAINFPHVGTACLLSPTLEHAHLTHFIGVSSTKRCSRYRVAISSLTPLESRGEKHHMHNAGPFLLMDEMINFDVFGVVW